MIMLKSNKTLFEQTGGMPAVNAAVDLFYKKVLSDQSICHFFGHVDIYKQAGKMKAFLAYAFGGQLAYTGKKMREAHSGMNIQESHFNSVAKHLVDTLVELDVEKEAIDQVVAIAMSTKRDVLGQ